MQKKIKKKRTFFFIDTIYTKTQDKVDPNLFNEASTYYSTTKRRHINKYTITLQQQKNINNILYTYINI